MTLDDILNANISAQQKIDIIKIFRKGGSTDDVNDAASRIEKLMKDVIEPAAKAGNKTALRLMNIDKSYYTFSDADIEKGYKGKPGTRGNVYLSSRGEFLTPSIQYRDDILTFLGPDPKWDKETEIQSIKFPSKEDAQFFAENYHNYPNIIPMLSDPVYQDYDPDEEYEKLKILKLALDTPIYKVDPVKALIMSGMGEQSAKDYLQQLQDNHQIAIIEKHQEGGSLRMSRIEIVIGGKEYRVWVAETEEQKTIGLSKHKQLASTAGMLFVYDSPQQDLWFTMEDTSIDLDIIFINSDFEVTSVNSVKANDPRPIPDKANNAQFVLEVNYKSGIKVGDKLENKDLFEDFSDEEKEKISKSKMLVLDENGNVQMKLEGGERIFSRISTRKIIKAALKAYRDEKDSDFIKLGKIVFTELDAQDGRDPEYVTAPK